MDLSGCDLKNTNLSGANLRGTDLCESKYDTTTIWPEGFNPQEQDAILVKNED